MKTETFKGEVTAAYGKDLPSAVKFNGEFQAFESYDEIKTANELPSNDEVLTFVNNKRKASARAAATTAALSAAGINKPDPNDPAVVRAGMVKSLMKLHNISEAVATQILAAAEQASQAAQ